METKVQLQNLSERNTSPFFFLSRVCVAWDDVRGKEGENISAT